jgi:hypothetical protein
LSVTCVAGIYLERYKTAKGKEGAHNEGGYGRIAKYFPAEKKYAGYARKVREEKQKFHARRTAERQNERVEKRAERYVLGMFKKWVTSSEMERPERYPAFFEYGEYVNVQVGTLLEIRFLKYDRIQREKHA